MTFQPVNSLLSWFIATEWKQFSAVLYWRLCGLTNSPHCYIPSQVRLMCMERRRFSQTMASEWQTAFVVSHKMPWCALLTAIKNYNKSLKIARLFLQDRDQDQMFKTKTKTSWSKTNTKTFIFVLEAPQDQDPGLEDYITDLQVLVMVQNKSTAWLDDV